MNKILLLLAFMATQAMADTNSAEDSRNMGKCMIKATEARFVGGMRDQMTYKEAMGYRPDLAPIIEEMFRGSLAMYSGDQVYSAISRMCIEKYQQ
ncbi:MAG: hypothetical protein ACXW1U_16445 [Methylobacter sp.]